MKTIATVFIFIAGLILYTSANAQSSYISSDGSYFGCVKKSHFRKIVDYAASGDKEAFKKALLSGLITGQCIPLKSGRPVYIIDTSIFSGLIKVRLHGDTTEYWTNIEAVYVQ